jgi:hypothetical protein
MGRSEDIPCERPLGLSHGLAVSWLGWPGLLGWPGWLAVLAWECVASSHGQAMGSPMRKGCEDGNGGSGSYFTWGGHRTPHVKRLGCLAGWTGRVGWLAWHAGWLPGRAGWPGWLAWQGWLAWPGWLAWLAWLAGLAGLAGWTARKFTDGGDDGFTTVSPRFHQP